jgi:hypothetical protein
MNIQALHNAIAAVCPIDGVAIARQSDKATWRIDCAAEATDQQKAAAQSVLAAFDITLLEDPKDLSRARSNGVVYAIRLSGDHVVYRYKR